MSPSQLNTYTVRAATPDDLPTITSIFLASLDTSIPGTTFSDHPEYAYDAVLSRMHGRVFPEDGGVKAFVAVDQVGEVAGYVFVKESVEYEPYEPYEPVGELKIPAKGPELDHLFVKVTPDAGGKGLGSALMRRVQEEPGWKGGLCTRCFAANDRAMRFYTKWGFEVVGRVSTPVGDALVLWWAEKA